MAKTKEQKRLIVEELKDKIAKQKAMVFVDFRGLKVKDLSKLRRELKKIDSVFMVAKKTLMKIALEENKMEADPEKMEGEIALVFGFKDEFSPLKAIYNFSKENQNLKVLGGYIESQPELLASEDIILMGQLPSKQELIGQVVRSISAPVSNFNYVLQANIKGLMRVLAQAKA